MLKVKFVMNSAILDVPMLNRVIFNPREMLGFLELKSLGFYKIKHGVLQQNMSNQFGFESAGVICEKVNQFVNTLKKEKAKSDDKING